jgi:hypothetical protein
MIKEENGSKVVVRECEITVAEWFAWFRGIWRCDPCRLIEREEALSTVAKDAASVRVILLDGLRTPRFDPIGTIGRSFQELKPTWPRTAIRSVKTRAFKTRASQSVRRDPWANLRSMEAGKGRGGRRAFTLPLHCMDVNVLCGPSAGSELNEFESDVVGPTEAAQARTSDRKGFQVDHR